MSDESDMEDRVDIVHYFVHQVLYYDKACGLPQIGHFVTNVRNEADQTFFANEETEDMLLIADEPDLILTFEGLADFMDGIPGILLN